VPPSQTDTGSRWLVRLREEHGLARVREVRVRCASIAEAQRVAVRRLYGPHATWTPSHADVGTLRRVGSLPGGRLIVQTEAE